MVVSDCIGFCVGMRQTGEAFLFAQLANLSCVLLSGEDPGHLVTMDCLQAPLPKGHSPKECRTETPQFEAVLQNDIVGASIGKKEQVIPM